GGSPPARAFQQKAKGRRFVDGREGPGLGMPVAPAQARPEAKVASDLLLQVKEEAVLEAVRLRKRYVGRNSGLCDGIGIIAHVSVVEIGHEADDAGTIEEHISLLKFPGLTVGIQDS